jgi:hypothetical protein
MGHPYGAVGPAEGLRVRAAVSHISRKTSEMPRFPVRSSGQDRVCAFLKGKAQEVQGTHETTQEIGGVGHPAMVMGIEPKSAFVSAFTCHRQASLLKSETWATHP